MSLELNINHSCSIKCPVCSHEYLYNFKIQDTDLIDSKEKENSDTKKYKFSTYLVCKNPLCNYDMEVIGDISFCFDNKLKGINIIDIK